MQIQFGRLPASDYYAVNGKNIAESVKVAAFFSTHRGGTVGEKAWEHWKDSGKPQGVGSGSPEAVKYAREMIKNCARFTGAVINYMLENTVMLPPGEEIISPIIIQ